MWYGYFSRNKGLKFKDLKYQLRHTFMTAAVFYSTVNCILTQSRDRKHLASLKEKRCTTGYEYPAWTALFQTVILQRWTRLFRKGPKQKKKHPKKPQQGFSTTLQQICTRFWGRLSNAARLWLCCFRGWLQTFPLRSALKNYSINHTLTRIKLPKIKHPFWGPRGLSASPA